jgi:signal transduction histidine kinase
MLILSHYLNAAIIAGRMSERAASAALYMQGFFGPHIDVVNGVPTVSQQRHDQLDDLLVKTELSVTLEQVRVYARDGTVIYSSDHKLIGRKMPSKDLDRAFAEEIVSQLEESTDEADPDELVEYPLLEIYAPIYVTGNPEPIAVAEFYEGAAEFESRLAEAQRQTMSIVGLTGMAIMALLYLIVRGANATIQDQQQSLSRELENAKALADQNKRLRRSADKARRNASRSNEDLLNRIGADIHDGPLQMLTLLVLRLGMGRRANPGSPGQPPVEETPEENIAKQVLGELRGISTGLVLPEIEKLPLEAALRLAVDRHEKLTGKTVATSFSALPENIEQSLKICLYRIVQEGLTNAYRHAGGIDQEVTVSRNAGVIEVIVSDGGPGLSPQSGKAGRHDPLGLAGIRHRVEAFGGTIETRLHKPTGVELVARVPLSA